MRLHMEIPSAFLMQISSVPVVPPVDAPLMSPTLIMLLCLLAGVATVFMLPGQREASIRKVAGVMLIAVGLIFAAMMPRLMAGSGGSADSIYFWIFSAIAIGGAVRVVTHARPVYSALYFVLTVFASAGLFILLEAEFMAAALILIYAGAILVTYVFVIMLATQASGDATHTTAMADYDAHSREPAAAAAIGFALMGALLFVIFDKATNIGFRSGPVPLIAAGVTDASSIPAAVPVSGATQELGMFLFRHQLPQLELAGLILLVSMVGAIIIARLRVVRHTPPPGTAKQPEVIDGPATPVDDNPHSIPVFGAEGRRQKAYV
jgi:NADH-quinone oxidoreductase subunit J